MATTIDKGSITVTKTDDPLVFLMEFDFTDEVVDVNQGWLVTWKHASFMYNTNLTGPQLIVAANAAMAKVRKPTAESNLETTLKANFGTTVVRVNPVIIETYQKVQIMAIDPAVIIKTDEVP